MKITINGFVTYFKNTGGDLFSKMTLPSGIDKETLTNNIIMQAGEFEIYYANPFFMQEAIGVWASKHQRTFQKWYDALQLEYEPIENYDRHESWTDTGTGTETSTGNMSGTSSDNTTALDKVSAYNSDTLRDNTQSTGTNNGTTSSTSSSNGSSSTSATHEGRTHGNIGVTTSQQMLQSELDVVRWNLYEHMTNLFIQEFCIPVYV